MGAGVEHHQPPNRIGGIDDPDVGPQPVAVDGEEEGSGLAAAALQQIGGAEEEVKRMTEHASSRQADTEPFADCAVGAVAGNKVARGDPRALPACEVDEVGRHPVVPVLEGLEPRAVTQAKARPGLCKRSEDRIEPELRADLQPHGTAAFRCLAAAWQSAHAGQLVAGEARHEHDVERIVGRERTVVDRFGDPPATAEFHRADIHLVHLRS